MMFPMILDDQSKLLVAVGLGAVLGVLLGGWIITFLHRLLMGVVKVVVLAAVLVAGVFLWSACRSTERPPSSFEAADQGYPASVFKSFVPDPPVERRPAHSDRWWEQ